MIPSLFAPLPKSRSSSTKGLFVELPRTGKICLSKYSLCSRSSIPTYLFGWCPDEAESRVQRSIYVVSGPGLVQALCKTSCIDPVILFNKDDKIGQSDIRWNPFTAVLEVLDLWGEAFSWGIGNEDRLGEEEVVLVMMMVMMMGGMVVRVNVSSNRMRLREEMFYGLGTGYKLSRGCMTSRNLRT